MSGGKAAGDKLYLSGNDVLLDSFRLARMIRLSGWLPDVMVVLWRGGAPVGITVHEYFVYKGLPCEHTVIKCASYEGLRQGPRLDIGISEEMLAPVSAGRRVVIIDDVFDTGRTAVRVRDLLVARGADVRIATLYWKPGENLTESHPDYHVHKTERWVVFPHELDGLTSDEIRRKGAGITAILED